MKQLKLFVLCVPFTPMLRIVKEGCILENVEFHVIQPLKNWKKYLFHFLRILGLNSLAVKLISRQLYQKIKLIKKMGCPVLYWNAHNLAEWLAIDKIIQSRQKYIFSWAPIDEGLTNNTLKSARIKRRIKNCLKRNFKFYTYNPHDALKYGMNLTTQVYRRLWNIEPQTPHCDFYFIGKSKGRRSILESLQKKLAAKNFSIDFRIFDDLPKEFVPYDENVRLTMGTRCIVDLVAKKYNAGMTLRPLEALFFKKKLLTNDISVKECDFYHPDNIFIFDEINMNLDGIEDFMKKPFHEINEKIVLKYDVNQWLKKYFFEVSNA